MESRIAHHEQLITWQVDTLTDHDNRLFALESKPEPSSPNAVPDVPWLKVAGMAALAVLTVSGHISPEVVKKVLSGVLGAH